MAGSRGNGAGRKNGAAQTAETRPTKRAPHRRPQGAGAHRRRRALHGGRRPVPGSPGARGCPVFGKTAFAPGQAGGVRSGPRIRARPPPLTPGSLHPRCRSGGPRTATARRTRLECSRWGPWAWRRWPIPHPCSSPAGGLARGAARVFPGPCASCGDGSSLWGNALDRALHGMGSGSSFAVRQDGAAFSSPSFPTALCPGTPLPRR